MMIATPAKVKPRVRCASNALVPPGHVVIAEAEHAEHQPGRSAASGQQEASSSQR